jgi:hypothetical protein
MNSFQDAMKVRSVIVTRPGTIRGRVIFRKLTVQLQPSISADISISLGIDFKKSVPIQTFTGPISSW